MATVTVVEERTGGSFSGSGGGVGGGDIAAVHDAAGNLIGLSAAGVISPSAVVPAFPNTPQVYCSPIAGEPDLVNVHSIANLPSHLGTGFMPPKAGILTEIGFITQGNTGAGTLRSVRWTVASLKGDPTAVTGIAIDQILDTGLTDIADNFNGNAVLATGKSLAVPPQFMVFVKTPIGHTLNVQLMNSAGPIPGVIGNLGAALLTSAATYSTTNIDVSNQPIAAGEKVTVIALKGIAMYIKWKGQ